MNLNFGAMQKKKHAEFVKFDEYCQHMQCITIEFQNLHLPKDLPYPGR